MNGYEGYIWCCDQNPKSPGVDPLKVERGPMRICTPACVDPELAVAFTQPYSKICVALGIVRPNTQTYWSSWSTETKPRQLCESQRAACLGHAAREKCREHFPAGLQNTPAAGTAARGASSPPAPHQHQHQSLSNTSTAKQLLPPHGMDGRCYGQAGREHTSSDWASPMKCSWHKQVHSTNELFQDN